MRGDKKINLNDPMDIEIYLNKYLGFDEDSFKFIDIPNELQQISSTKIRNNK